MTRFRSMLSALLLLCCLPVPQAAAMACVAHCEAMVTAHVVNMDNAAAMPADMPAAAPAETPAAMPCCAVAHTQRVQRPCPAAHHGQPMQPMLVMAGDRVAPVRAVWSVSPLLSSHGTSFSLLSAALSSMAPPPAVAPLRSRLATQAAVRLHSVAQRV